MPGLFEQLRSHTGPLWDSAQAHPFVARLADGTLPRATFAFYLAQDYLYLTAYSRAIALACARAESLSDMAGLAALLHETQSFEMQLHRDYCAGFGLGEDELARTAAAPITQAYGDFCISAAATGGPLQLLAALLPCGLGYAEIGSRHLAAVQAQRGHPYAQWFAAYGGAEYGQAARWMRDALNRLGEGLPARAFPRLSALFTTGCRYEWLFWEMAWTRQAWPV
jgi:thiaminase (transcriptional activator TenA)